MKNKEELNYELYDYVSNYDMNDKMIYLKYLHSLRVANISEKIAKNLNLDYEKINIAYLIGLLHDIGRFEQITKYQTFSDSKSNINHADLGADILFNKNLIRKFINDKRFDNIINKSIRNHNKFEIEKELNDEELLFSKIIRDADKIDIFNILINENTLDEINKCNGINSNSFIISEDVKNNFNNFNLIKLNQVKTIADKYINIISFVFDINFDISFKIIKNNEYINKFINKIYESFNLEFNFKNEFQKMADLANTYIDEKIRRIV